MLLVRNGLVADRTPSDETDSNKHWFAVYTKPNGETNAAWHLEVQNFRTFLPKRRKTVRHARKLRIVDAPYFPRYLFVAMDLERDQWRRVNSTIGVSFIITNGEMPLMVPSGLVETIIETSDDNGVIDPTNHLRVGGSVRMMAGPFADQLAVIDRMDDSDRVRVLLEIMGGQVAVSTSSRNLLPIRH